MGQFKSMVTTEGAGTADAAGNLTSKYSRWVANTLPGLQQAFNPSEVGVLQRIGQDVDRTASANKHRHVPRWLQYLPERLQRSQSRPVGQSMAHESFEHAAGGQQRYEARSRGHAQLGAQCKAVRLSGSAV